MGLFKFKTPEDLASVGAQIIVPENEDSQIVNVVMDYAWTIQPKTARLDVPYIYLIERKLTNDVIIQQLIYNIKATLEVGGESAAQFKQSLIEKYPELRNNNRLEEIEKEVTQENPYSGLYSLEDTGWNYVLPYFDKQHHNMTGNWATPDEAGGFVNRFGGTVNNLIAETATGVNQIISALGAASGAQGLVRPGTYIERAKQYKFDAQGPSYSVEFDLFNTGTVEDVIKNWELCFALMYNLLPNRRTKTVFDPPPLYEVMIPGVRRSPVSFIKGMQVNFLGSTRLMDLDVAGQTAFRTIVPDAYSIKLDIEDVLPESKNFMQSMIDEERRVVVTTTTEGETSPRNYTPTNEEVKANNITHITLNKTQRNGVNKVDKSNVGKFSDG